MDARMKGPNGEDLTPPHGVPARELLRRHDSDIEGLKAGVGRVEGMLGGLMGEVGALAGRVDSLATDVRHALRLASTPPPPPMPPMRAELPSTVSPGEFRSELRQVARRGEKDPTTTAEAEVEKYLERVDLIRRGRLFNKILWLAITGAAGLAVDRIILALGHH